MRPAEIERRLWARVIDMAVLSPALLTLLNALLYVHFFDFSLFDGPSQDDPSGWAWVLVWAAIVVLVLYEPVMVARGGATLGKLAMGIRVVRVTDASAPGWLRSTARMLIPQLVGVVTFGILWFVGNWYLSATP